MWKDVVVVDQSEHSVDFLAGVTNSRGTCQWCWVSGLKFGNSHDNRLTTKFGGVVLLMMMKTMMIIIIIMIII